MEEQENTLQKRQIAFKVKLIDLVSGQYHVEEGWNPNYVLINGNQRVSRVNIIGTIVNLITDDEGRKSLYIDDGSCEMAIRSFSEIDIFRDISVGDVVTVIGKVREYSNEKYLIAELIRKMQDPRWLVVRNLEIKKLKPKTLDSVSGENVVNEESIVADVEEVVSENAESNDSEVIVATIKKLDTGDGADMDKVILECKVSNAEEMVNNLLMNGEIFELRPGKLKVLE